MQSLLMAKDYTLQAARASRPTSGPLRLRALAPNREAGTCRGAEDQIANAAYLNRQLTQVPADRWIYRFHKGGCRMRFSGRNAGIRVFLDFGEDRSGRADRKIDGISGGDSAAVRDGIVELAGGAIDAEASAPIPRTQPGGGIKAVVRRAAAVRHA